MTAGIDRELVAMRAARSAPARSVAEQAVERHLRAAIELLKAANAAGEVAGYGDQFTGSVDEAIQQANYSLRMLS